MKVTTVWQGKRAFNAVGPSGNSVPMDASTAYGGDGSAATPMELLLAGLTGCMGIDITMILDQSLASISSITMEAEGARREAKPSGFSSVVLTFHIEGDVPDYRVWKAIEMSAEKYCSVADSLNADISYKLVLNGKAYEQQP